jgi:hypothetical protein
MSIVIEIDRDQSKRSHRPRFEAQEHTFGRGHKQAISHLDALPLWIGRRSGGTASQHMAAPGRLAMQLLFGCMPAMPYLVGLREISHRLPLPEPKP